MSKRITLPLIAAVLLLAGAAAISLSGRTGTARAAAGDGSFVPHPTLVPSEPQLGYPRTLTTPYIGTKPRQTYATDLVAGYILSGGNFLNVEKQDGTVVAQEYLAIYDTETKLLQCESLQVDGEVLSFAPGPQANTMIMGGKFNKVMGADGVWRTRNKIAMIHLDTCEVNPNWIVTGLNGRVIELAVSGDRLFLGGDFTQVNGQPIAHLAEVNYNTAALNPAMSFTFQAGNVSGKRIVGLEAKPDGTRLAVGHRAIAIDGISMRGTAVFDISNPANPVLTPHRLSTTSKAYTYYYDIQDVAVDPNFTFFAIAQGTATVSDYVTRANVTEAPEQFVFEHFMQDSSFSVDVSNNAIYVGGHFCRIAPGPRASEMMTPNTLAVCSGTNMNGGNGVWRSQLAALDPADGTPLTWNPGNDALVGARSITVVSRGLLVGYDGTYTHGAATYRNVGTTAFFDFGDNGEPEPPAPSCTVVVNNDNTVTVEWDAVEGVNQFQIRRNGKWIDDVEAATTYVDVPGAGSWTYEVRYRQGGVNDIECGPAIEIAAGPAPRCMAVLNADGSVTLKWDAIAGTSAYTIRKNDAWLATVGDETTYTDPIAGPEPSYVVRSFNNGVVTDVLCEFRKVIAVDDGPILEPVPVDPVAVDPAVDEPLDVDPVAVDPAVIEPDAEKPVDEEPEDRVPELDADQLADDAPAVDPVVDPADADAEPDADLPAPVEGAEG